MKKLINKPGEIVNEVIDGFVAANKDRVKRIDDYTIIARRDLPISDKVAIVTGGGSGHEPLFLEYVGNLYGIYHSIWGLLLNMMGRSIFE